MNYNNYINEINYELFKDIATPYNIHKNNLFEILDEINLAQRQGTLLSLYEKYIKINNTVNYSINFIIAYIDSLA